MNGERWTAADVLEARATASFCARVILDGEVGGVGYDPYRDGKAGEKGPFQLLPRGELRTFYARAYTDPHDPWQSLHFTEQRLREGGGSAWTTAPRGCR